MKMRTRIYLRSIPPALGPALCKQSAINTKVKPGWARQTSPWLATTIHHTPGDAPSLSVHPVSKRFRTPVGAGMGTPVGEGLGTGLGMVLGTCVGTGVGTGVGVDEGTNVGI